MVDIYRNDCNKEEIIEHALPNYKGESPSPCTRAVSTAGMKSGINLALPMLCAWAFALGAYAQERLDFVTVTLDEETREADEKLMRYLEEEVGLEFSRREYEYGTVINRLADWDLEDNGEFLARTTPYEILCRLNPRLRRIYVQSTVEVEVRPGATRPIGVA